MPAPIPKFKNILNGQYRKNIIDLINDAKFSINIMMFEWRWYTKDISCDMSLINQALLRAKKRGVKIRGIVNTATQRQILIDKGFDIKTNQKSILMHTKVIVFDSKIYVIGSHNFTENAMQSNEELSCIINDDEGAKQINNYFDTLWRSSTF